MSKPLLKSSQDAARAAIPRLFVLAQGNLTGIAYAEIPKEK
jgi:hypothetical protein